MDLITVRDTISKKKLCEVTNTEVIVTADPAFVFDCPDTETSNMTGVNFRPWYDISKERLSYYFDYSNDICRTDAKQKYIENANRIINEVENPVFIPFHQTDVQFAKDNLEVDVLDYTGSVNKTLMYVSKMEKMVTTRFHSLVFAAICNKPSYVLSYAPKVGSLADRLNISHRSPHLIEPIKFECPSDVHIQKNLALENFNLLEEEIVDACR